MSMHKCVVDAALRNAGTTQGMKPYFIKYRDSWSFTPEKSFNLAGFGNEFSNITGQFTTRDWLPYLDAPGGYYPNLLLEFYALFQTRQDSMKHSGRGIAPYMHSMAPPLAWICLRDANPYHAVALASFKLILATLSLLSLN
ncbi:hypothetical protein HAX54_023545 [Datura stramonium]|uniref:Uncharacterized protein n=1 Tax=Datura stramonium TaxID=4076 RepID=A0ABS8S5B9_DATST|nr:hypothetical protein [Datura stramonium]